MGAGVCVCVGGGAGVCVRVCVCECVCGWVGGAQGEKGGAQGERRPRHAPSGPGFSRPSPSPPPAHLKHWRAAIWKASTLESTSW